MNIKNIKKSKICNKAYDIVKSVLEFYQSYPKILMATIVILCFISPYVIIFFMVKVLKLIFTFNIKDVLFSINVGDYSLDLKDYFSIFVGVLQAVITGVFSYFLWITALKSNKLSEQMQEREDNKDKSIVRENALIVYYDLTLGIRDLIKLYDKKIKGTNTTVPKRLYFSNEWIKNVAILKGELNHKDIDEIYLLYGDFLTIKEFLEENNSELNIEIDRVFNKVISENILDYIGVIDLSNFSSELSMMNTYYISLFEKLKQLIFSKKEMTIKEFPGKEKFSIILNDRDLRYHGGLSGLAFNLYGELYNENFRERLKGIFKDGIFTDGIRKEYYNNGELFYEMRYQDSKRCEGKIYSYDKKKYAEGTFLNDMFIDGKCIKYTKEGRLVYEGEFKFGEYCGHGIYYDETGEKEGTWLRGKFYGNANFEDLLREKTKR